MKKTFALVLIVVLIAGCATPAPAINPPDYWPTNGWQNSTPEEQGMDSNVLVSMFDHVAEQQLNLRSVLIIRNGYLVTEAYFHPYTAETPHTIESITKSVIDALIGIAIDQKYVKDADQSLLSFYPADRRIDNLDTNKQAIKLKDLLSLTAGFECDDAPNSDNRTMTQSENWVAFMLNSPMAAAPGSTFNYCSGAAHILSDVLQRSVNMSAREYANEQLFKPLGIAAVPTERWGTDPQGVSTGGFGLYLTPRDVAKLGLLYLNNGQWDGKQIVPADWVAASTTQHAAKEDGTGYGYLWTVYPNENRYAALGLAGQQLHVLPKQNLVVVFTSGLPVYGEAPQLNELIKNYIVPAVKSDTALPENSIGVGKLTADIQTIANPKQPVPAVPALAQTISGKTYRLDDNPFGWQTMSFTFQPDSATAKLVIATDKTSQEEDIGLDNLYREVPGGSGLRGHWADDGSFIAEQIQLGQIVEYEYRLTFNANDLNIEMTDRIFGGEPLRLHASLTPVSSAQPIVIDTRADLQSLTNEIVRAEPIAAQARADELWQTLIQTQRVPLVFGNQVIFFYKGPADKVDWRGTFNGWSESALEGQRLGQTDLWVSTQEFPSASRVEYKIVVNDKDWVVDTANPKTTFSGMTGVNNVITLRGFTVTDLSQKRTDITPGTLTGEFSLTSQYLGYPIGYWVYTPVGYENLKQLPVLYVLDGNDFVDERMGALPNVLDNLIADKRIEPVIAVFVDSRDPNNPTFNRREEEFLVHPIDHAKFIADELVPTIDRTYRTDPQPGARVIAGVSYGGIGAAYIGVSRSEVFHNLAAFSMSYWVLESPQYLSKPEQAAGVKLMLPAFTAMTQCGGETGFTCPRLPLKIFLSAGFADWDVGDFTPLVNGLQAQGYPVEFHQVREGHSWDNWRGLSDEMLIDFFGSD